MKLELLLVAILCLLFVRGHSIDHRSPLFVSLAPIATTQQPARSLSACCTLRGGSDQEEEEEDEVELVDEGSETTGSKALKITTKIVKAIGKAGLATALALKRSVVAAFQRDETEEDEEEPSAVQKVLRTMKRMWSAALNASDSSPLDLSGVKHADESSSIDDDDDMGAGKQLSDFGSYLSRTYGVTDGRGEVSTPVLGGTIGDALLAARSKARLLVVFVPGKKPSRNKKGGDQLAIRSVLSEEVAALAEKRARKKSETGSYLLWGAKPGSPEAVTALKRLRARQPPGKEKRPMLVVAYPAQTRSPNGKPTKIVPQLLAQHHCNPPPSAESMAAWLDALRKRHAKQFAIMQRQLKEVEYFKERRANYKSSVVSDTKRKEDERRAEEERLALEAAEKAKQEALEKRREELKDGLPEEPAKDASDVMTIALRFADGRTGQRRFEASTALSTVFNWVDGYYAMEREKVTLTTMNGKLSFTWDDHNETTLKEAGLSRMTGLRVMEQKGEEEETPKKVEQ